MTTLYYFAYGSNMSMARLRQRVPSAEKLGIFALASHELRFDKKGRDGSGKCNALYTGNDSDTVFGTLFSMKADEKPTLDEAESLGVGYGDKTVTVTNATGESFEALTYYALRLDANYQPYDWYLNHVLIGAFETGLPLDYIAKIEAVESKPDPDRSRAATQWAVHD
ncbi:hypothetical protein SIN8267_01674 [Sinobacterium norvegicum]|uniref:Gamma-glutamylcyclotransferase n=1 Tax=Sinobacterium norvegicum TaxID=1641715 RepID=A0ABM9AEU6_9GAMM|nr:gamma-glutamylcyclotransferase family protein [Sinobacterium norvegicum]CAH0991565.1 hypothetical protein SIN8267_01674 [Sinobacterium norvegicum]